MKPNEDPTKQNQENSAKNRLNNMQPNKSGIIGIGNAFSRQQPRQRSRRNRNRGKRQSRNKGTGVSPRRSRCLSPHFIAYFGNGESRRVSNVQNEDPPQYSPVPPGNNDRNSHCGQSFSRRSMRSDTNQKESPGRVESFHRGTTISPRNSRRSSHYTECSPNRYMSPHSSRHRPSHHDIDGFNNGSRVSGDIHQESASDQARNYRHDQNSSSFSDGIGPRILRSPLPQHNRKYSIGEEDFETPILDHIGVKGTWKDPYGSRERPKYDPTKYAHIFADISDISEDSGCDEKLPKPATELKTSANEKDRDNAAKSSSQDNEVNQQISTSPESGEAYEGSTKKAQSPTTGNSPTCSADVKKSSSRAVAKISPMSGQSVNGITDNSNKLTPSQTKVNDKDTAEVKKLVLKNQELEYVRRAQERQRAMLKEKLDIAVASNNEKDKQLAELREELGQKNEKIAKLEIESREKLAQKDAKITELTKQFFDASAQNDAKVEELRKLLETNFSLNCSNLDK